MDQLGDKVAYTIHEAIEATGLGKNFIYELMNTGQLGFVRRGKGGTKRVIPKFELERWLKENLEFAERPRRKTG